MVELTLPFLGAERGRWQYPFGDLHRSGARLVAGSDWPVSTPNPLEAIHVAVNRWAYGEEGPAGSEPFLPEQSLALETAFAAYTSGSAWVNHRDDAGTIAAGQVADLVVLDRDPFAGGPRRDRCRAGGLHLGRRRRRAPGLSCVDAQVQTGWPAPLSPHPRATAKVVTAGAGGAGVICRRSARCRATGLGRSRAEEAWIANIKPGSTRRQARARQMKHGSETFYIEGEGLLVTQVGRTHRRRAATRWTRASSPQSSGDPGPRPAEAPPRSASPGSGPRARR